MKGNLESLRILRDSASLGAVGGNFVPHPCPPAVRRMRVTLGGHCVPDGGIKGGDEGQGSLEAAAEAR